MASIRDVAKLANVSVATVSRVINGTSPVHPDTKKRVEQAIKELAYTPNILARNFRRDESRVIMILTPNITNPYYAYILTGIGDEAKRQGYQAFISTVETKVDREEALSMLAFKQADGAILLASEIGTHWLEDYYEKYPLVLCSEFDPDTNIPHLSIDNYRASMEIMEYLYSMGHRKIAHVSSENQYNSTRLRLKAYVDFMEEHSLPINEGYIFKASKDYSFRSGKRASKHFLSLDNAPTAVFCISDTLAMGCVIQAQESGYDVPKDFSVTGFDDVENTTMIRPYITTIAQPCYEMGVEVTSKLCSLIKKKNVNTTTVVDHNMIIRDSVYKLG